MFPLPENGLLFIISAPAGVGKTTLVQMLVEEYKCVKASTSCTTRTPRPRERDGEDYFFLSVEQFQKKIAKGDFLEHALVFGNYYGTCRDHVLQQRRKGNHVILVIDTQGAQQLKNKIDGISIFIHPPSMHELRRRLVGRKTENPESIEDRLAWAEKEIQAAAHYDYQTVNEDLSTCYQVLKSIIIAEVHRSHRLQVNLFDSRN